LTAVQLAPFGMVLRLISYVLGIAEARLSTGWMPFLEWLVGIQGHFQHKQTASYCGRFKHVIYGQGDKHITIQVISVTLFNLVFVEITSSTW